MPVFSQRASVRLIAIFVLAAALAATVPASASAATNLLKNPGFEEPALGAGGLYSPSAGQSFPDANAWTVTQNAIDVADTDFQYGGDNFQSRSGRQAIDINSVSPGGIRQDVPTAAGRSYQISFFMSASGICGVASTDTISVQWDGKELGRPTLTATAGVGPGNYQRFEYLAPATSSSTRLAITSISPNDHCGAALDDFSVTAVDAAPMTIDGHSNVFAAGRATTGAVGGGELPQGVVLPNGPSRSVRFGSVTGKTNCGDGKVVIPPDGSSGCGASATNISGVAGISGLKSTGGMFLAGVFVGPGEAADPQPPVLNFTATGLTRNFSNLSPALNQTFFIGDGRRTDGTQQAFAAPDGATRLYLGFVDGTNGTTAWTGPPGHYHDNGGSLSAVVEVTGAPADGEIAVDVASTDDIWAAGRSSVPAFPEGGGTLPRAVTLPSGGTRTVTLPAVAGAVGCNGAGESVAPDGGPGCGGNLTDLPAYQGISGVKADGAMMLFGVFLDSTEPAGTAPAKLDFTSAGKTKNFGTLSPALKQVFFVGDGRTSSGALQSFKAPTGATRLFLGIADGPGPNVFQVGQGGYQDNFGAYSALVKVASNTASPGCTHDVAAGVPFVGTAGNDVICGTPDADVIDGGGGVDKIYGRGGGDRITGNDAAADQLYGEAGDDTINGKGGHDSIYGGSGQDTLGGDAGADKLYGEDDGDTINGGAEVDVVFGDAGDDRLNGDSGSDRLWGGQGTDVIDGGLGSDNMFGDSEGDEVTYAGRGVPINASIGSSDAVAFGNDGAVGEYDNIGSSIEVITGGMANDKLTGSTARNFLRGGKGNDQLRGEPDSAADGSDDRLDGGLGADLLQGGPGAWDVVSYDGDGRSTGATIWASIGDSADEGANDGTVVDGETVERDDILSDIEGVIGGPGADVIVGTDRPEHLNGSDGDDHVFSGAGDDVMIGSGGADVLFGEGGDDVFTGDPGPDTYWGGAGRDTADYGDADVLFGYYRSVIGARTEPLNITLGGGTRDGGASDGAGDDVKLDVERVIGGSANDRIVGSSRANLLWGMDGEDELIGGLGADTLYGGLQKDTLRTNGDAASGRDTAHCGEGTDILHRDSIDVFTSCETRPLG